MMPPVPEMNAENEIIRVNRQIQCQITVHCVSNSYWFVNNLIMVAVRFFRHQILTKSKKITNQSDLDIFRQDVEQIRLQTQQLLNTKKIIAKCTKFQTDKESFTALLII